MPIVCQGLESLDSAVTSLDRCLIRSCQPGRRKIRILETKGRPSVKIRRVKVENVRSFLNSQELIVPGNQLILIGPNGGGKTNLLDICILTLRLFVLKSWTAQRAENRDGQWREWKPNQRFDTNIFLEKHSSGQSKPQRIEIDVEITQSDLDAMSVIQLNWEWISSQTGYKSIPSGRPQNWDMGKMTAGQLVSFTLLDKNLERTTCEKELWFRDYLGLAEAAHRMLVEFDRAAFSLPVLSLPVQRTDSGMADSVSLADFDDYEHKGSIDLATSRTPSNQIIGMAIGMIATQYRKRLEKDSGAATDYLLNDPQMVKLTKTLKSLGYEWSLKAIEILRNRYTIGLKKQGRDFNIHSASAGEKELLTYVFGIYALNVRDALIVIDEPELHLHPSWQRDLLKIFGELAEATGNQFIMATHSPAFVTPETVQHVARVFSSEQRSQILQPHTADLPEVKHLIQIVNSMNNERLFFADLVVLVEGISDQLVFSRLLEDSTAIGMPGKICEVIRVGGKTMFSEYRKILNTFKIKNVAIADLDFAKNIGTPEVKALFKKSPKKIKTNVIDNPGSHDFQGLVSTLDEAITTQDITKLQAIWTYLVARHTALNVDELDTAQKEILTDFIEQQKSTEDIFILSRGAIEAYLPDGYHKKDVSKIVELCSQPGLAERLRVEAKEELEQMCLNIKDKL